MMIGYNYDDAAYRKGRLAMSGYDNYVMIFMMIDDDYDAYHKGTCHELIQQSCDDHEIRDEFNSWLI